MLAGDGADSVLGILIVLAPAGFMVYRLIQGEFRQVVLYAIAGFLVLSFLAPTPRPRPCWPSSGTVRFAYQALIWLLFERLYITNRRVILARGFLGSDISTMPLTRVTDINYTTTVPGELLGYAELRVETAGQDQALSTLQYLEKPAKFYATLIDLSTAAVGSVTEPDESQPPPPIITTEMAAHPQDPNAHIGTLDEDDGGGTLAP